MKKLIAIILLFSSGSIQAQEPVAAKATKNNSAEPLRQFALGVRTFNLTNDMIESPITLPGNKIIATVNAHEHFRMQAEVGYMRVKVKSTLYKDGVTDKAVSVAGGAYGMWQREKTNLYAGLKYVYATSKDQSLYYSGTGTTYQVFTQTINTNGYGVVLGGEYMLGKHFSLGAEVSFLRCTSRFSDTYPGSIAQDAFFLLTETNLLARFYF